MSSDRAILVVEDDKMVRSSICLNLEAANYRPHGVDNGETALELIGKNQFDLVLCDLRIPQLDGISFVKKCRQIDPKVAVVVMSAFGEETQILEAIRAGAQDYIAKPFELDQLILTLRKVEEREHLNTSSASEGSELQKYRFSNIIAQSESMREIFETVKRLANFNTTVLITGESGTGKELIAHAIHHNSPRSGRPFIAINCGAIPETLMESELFGHRKGAFTDATRDKKGLFEEASGGNHFSR
ncbi:MAG: sigma-54-dependent Fis family transcriptional regulator [Bdellovibrionales bacterium]|nr:sigma-54-dependent Fis family transcriptional regulator [Bdellovibrionales bacterium]